MYYFKRKLLIAALAFGTVAGYASGFAHMGACAASCHQQRRAAFEDHVAEVCTRAAQRVRDEQSVDRAPFDAAGVGATE